MVGKTLKSKGMGKWEILLMAGFYSALSRHNPIDFQYNQATKWIRLLVVSYRSTCDIGQKFHKIPYNHFHPDVCPNVRVKFMDEVYPPSRGVDTSFNVWYKSATISRLPPIDKLYQP